MLSPARHSLGLGLAAPVQTPQMKSQIELFVGNIPVGTTQQGLVDFLNAAMLKASTTTSDRWAIGFIFTCANTAANAVTHVSVAAIQGVEL